MNKFKIEDFNVGDKVTFVGIVKENDGTSFPLWVEFQDGSNEWFSVSSIATHEPVRFKVGDRVRDVRCGVRQGVVLAMDGENLWLKNDIGSRWTDVAADFEVIA